MSSADFPYVEFDGHRRYLACLPSSDDGKKRFKNWSAAGNPVLAKSDWKERTSRGNGVPILDQKQTNACVAFSGTRILMNTLRRAGHPVINLAPFHLYSFINGGRDAGANISDALTAMMAHGICPLDKAPSGAMYRNQFSSAVDAEGKLFLVTEGYGIDTWEEACSAATLGWDLAWSVHAGNSTMDTDKYGVCGYSRGMANHGVQADGLKYIAELGDWYLDWPNSWGTQFGDNGRVYAGERHFECPYREMYAVRSALVDVTYDPTLPPNVA